jgi:hypothetical protein
MNEVLKDITPIITNIKLCEYVYLSSGNHLILGNDSVGFVIDNKNVGYKLLSNTNSKFLNYPETSAIINIDNYKIFLTIDNILLFSKHRTAIDLNSKKVYTCTSSEFNSLKTELSDKTKIKISNVSK